MCLEERQLIPMAGLLDLFGHPAYPAPKDQSLLAREDIIYQAQAAAQEGIFFTEVMKGFIHIGADIDDFDVAAEHAKSECADARFFLSVAAYDTDTCEFVHPPFILTMYHFSTRYGLICR